MHYHYHGGYGESYSRTTVENGPDGERRAVHHHYYYEPPRPVKERSNKPRIAGSLLLIAGILGILFGIALSFGAAFMSDMPGLITSFGGSETEDVFGTVKLQDGTPAADVNISIVGEDINTTTDLNGKYRLFDVPIGQQEIMVEHPGYKTIIKTVFVNSESNSDSTNTGWDPTADTSNEHDFILQPGEGEERTGEEIPFDLITAVLGICAVVSIAFSIMTMVGGFFALKRKNFGIAVLGAIFGILAVGFFIGTILSFITLFILLLSREEFS